MSVEIKEERLACFLPQHPRLDTRRLGALGNNYIFLRFFRPPAFLLPAASLEQTKRWHCALKIVR